MRYSKRIIFIILAAMGTLCFNGCQTNVSSGENNSEENAYMKLSAEEAKEIMDSTEDYILLDVREEDEYAEAISKMRCSCHMEKSQSGRRTSCQTRSRQYWYTAAAAEGVPLQPRH